MKECIKTHEQPMPFPGRPGAMEIKKVHNSKEIDELHSLLAMLEHTGPCTTERTQGVAVDCIYVKEGHPGCAIGRRMNEKERNDILANGANHLCIEALSGKGYMPKYFTDWDPMTLHLLQSVHDTHPHKEDDNRHHHIERHAYAIKQYEEHVAELA
tara:strand:- start:383 stop:850 length:468 start_codon:yes stop_codon:yes gene_type:complete